MDLIETVGAKLVLLGQREYVAGMTEARAAHKALGEAVQATTVPSAAMREATIANQAAQDQLAAAMRGAVAAQKEYVSALAASAEADAAVVEGADAAALAKATEAKARLDAAAAARTASLTEVEAEQRSAAAATTAAAEVEAAEARKAQAAEVSSGAMKMAMFGVVAVAGTVAAVGVKMAADFESATERLVTSAGEDQKNLGMVRDGILSMAGAVGYSSDDLAKAMYTVESGGQHGADGLKVLQAAAEGAKTENADLVEVADAVTSVLQDYHLKASDAAMVTSKLVAATSAGKTTFQQLASSMSAVLPVASANHVSLNDILGDLASMTVHGMSANQAAQNLTDTIRHMAAPTQLQSKELAALGINSQQLSSDLGTKGLSGTLQEIAGAIQSRMGPAGKVVVDLTTALKGLPGPVQELGAKLLSGQITLKDYTAAAKDLDPIAAAQATQFKTLATGFYTVGTGQTTGMKAMQSYTDAMRKATGDATGLNVALMLTGENTATTTKAIDTVSGATAEAGGHVRGWAEIQDTFNTKMAQAKDGLGALAIQIGTVLLPPLSFIVGVFADAVHWISENSLIATALAVVIGGVLVLAIVALTVATWGWVSALFAADGALAFIEWPILLIVAGIALLVAGLIWAYNNLGWFHDAVDAVWSGIKWAVGEVVDFFIAAWGEAVAAFHVVAGVVVGIGHIFGVVFGAIGAAASWLYSNILKPVFDAIVIAAKVLIAIIVVVLVTPFVIAFHLLSAVVLWVWHTVLEPALQRWGVIFTWLYQNIVKPVFENIQRNISMVWNWLVANVFRPIGDEVTKAGRVFVWLYQNAVLPVWNNIKSNVGMVWGWLVANVFHPIGDEIAKAGAAFNMFYNAVIKPVWDHISSAISVAWNWIRDNVFAEIHKALTVLGDAFGAARDLIAQQWDGVKSVIATPIHWVVDVVYTHGIKQVWDGVADFVGLGHLPDAPKFAGGGVIDGYAPGVDDVPAVLSRGEAVLVPEAVAAIGPANILELNRRFSGGRPATILGDGYSGGGLARFAGGGIDVTGSAGATSSGSATTPSGGFTGWLSGVVGDVASVITDPKAAFQKVIASLTNNPIVNSPLGQDLIKIPAKAIDGLVNKIMTSFSAGGGGLAASSAQVQMWVLQALALMGLPAAYAPGIESLIQHESGGNPSAINLTDSNATAGHPSQGLMQTIPSTFHAYVLPALANRPITDPIANITAGVRYALARYGPSMLMSGGRHTAAGAYMGYSGGGLVGPVNSGLSAYLPARAEGGPVSSGKPYLVGERGAEVFVPDSAGQVHSNKDSAAMGALGGTTVVLQAGAVVINEAHDPQACYEAAKKGIADAVARR